MAIYYIDGEGGDDNNSGDSFSLTTTRTDGVTNGTTLFTSAGASFTTALTGRTINILTKGFYYIAAAPSSTTLTLSVIGVGGTALPSAGSSLSYYIGGRWRTYNNVTRSNDKPVRITDTVRVMASPSPTLIGNGTWVKEAKTMYLQDRVIANVDSCASGFTASANVTYTGGIGNSKDGDGASQFAIAAGFTGGKIAYKQLSTVLNLSAFAQISLWFKCTALASNAFRLCLCSDTTGDAVIQHFDIPFTLNTGGYPLPLTLISNLSSNLPSNVQSISLSATRAPGAVTMIIDNIVACLSSTDPKSINLQSLFGKNNNHPQDHWWCVKYLSAGPVSSPTLSGTTVGFDMYTSNTNMGSVVFKGYPYVSETVPTYKIETIKAGQGANGGVTPAIIGSQINWSPPAQTTPNLNSEISYLNIIGGYSRVDMSTLDFMTFYDGLDGQSQCLVSQGSQQSYSNFGTVRFFIGAGTNNSQITKWTNIQSHCCTNSGLQLNTSLNILSSIKASCNSIQNIYIGLGSTSAHNRCYNITADNAGTYNMYSWGDINNYYENLWLSHSNSYSIFLRNSFNSVYNGITSLNNTTGFTYNSNNDSTVFYNVSTNNAVVAFGNFSDNGGQYSHYTMQGFNGVADDIRVYMSNGGMALSEYGAMRRTPSGYAWKLMSNFNATFQSLQYPYIFKIATVAARANTPVRVSGYIRSNTTLNIGGILCKEDPYNKIVETRATATLVTNTYVPVSLTVTPTVDCVIPFYFWGVLNTSPDFLIIDDITVS